MMDETECPQCGSDLLVERRQVVLDDPDELHGTIVSTCPGCTYRSVVYADLD